MPQPIDFQTELVRTTTVERVQQAADRLSLAATQRSAQELDAERVAAETEVQQTQDKPEQVDRDLKRRNPYVGRRRRPAKSKQTENAETPETNTAAQLVEPHQLDITI